MAKQYYTAKARERASQRYYANKATILARNKERHRNNKDRANERHRRDSLRKLYGMTPEEYDEWFYKQGGQCAICGREDAGRKGSKYFSIDHDHKTGKVRGLLCRHCNVGLGSFMDDPELLVSAIQYLQTEAKNVDEEGSD